MSKQYIVKNGIAVEVKETVKEIPSREDSLDRPAELGLDFADRTTDFREPVAEKIMLT